MKPDIVERLREIAELIQVDVVERGTAGSGPDLVHRPEFDVGEFDVGWTAKAASCGCWLCRRERGENVSIMVLCPKCGKRPFGNSDWKYEVFAALVRGGAVPGEKEDERYYADDFDVADAAVRLAIGALR